MNNNYQESTDFKVMLSAKDLKVKYDYTLALKIPKLDITTKVLGIVGHNGAGKSTLLKAILGLLPSANGSISCLCSANNTILSSERDMSFCPESGSVFNDIPVEDYIKLWCRLKLRSNRAYFDVATEYIERLDLTNLLKKRGRELSKGQRRRVQTAIGFITKPRLFLFDEPFDGLDVQRTRELAELISEHSIHTSFLISSHRMDVIERVADNLLVLNQGEVLASGEIGQVSSQLAGTTITVASSVTADLSYRIQRALPGSYIGRSGNLWVITGHNLNEDRIKSVFHEIDGKEVRTEISQPSLMDAMNFHLSLSSSSRSSTQ